MAQGTHKVFTKKSPRTPIRVPVVRNPPFHLGRTSADVSRFSPVYVQPALKVGAANDLLEREAESTAERIVSMPAPQIAPPISQPLPSGNEQNQFAAAQRASIDDQPNLETLEATPPIPADHQDPEVPQEEDVDTTGLAANDMKEIESGQPEDTAGESPAEETPPPTDEQPVARAARSDDTAIVGAKGGPAPADVAGRVSQPGSGRPLPVSVRTFMEPRFGKDFSDVRIHDTPSDRSASKRIGARAFTHRQHIWIGPGESVENRRLLAHELTHVVQQTKRSPVPVIKREVDTTEDSEEPAVRRGYTRNKAEKYARKVPGYRLISVILGKSPITGNRVERNATNLLGALLALIPGGGELFDRLMETRVIQEAFEWIDKQLTRLNITWTRIKSIISDILDYLMDWPSDVISYAKKKFSPLVQDIVTFIGQVKDKILEFIIRGALKLGGEWAEKIWGVIKKAGSAIGTILKDPIGFAKNLFGAVVKGFKQFGSNIFTHIKKGLLGWLFGAMKGLNIQIPEKLDFKGLISIGLQIVGLTYANFRAKLVDRLGENGERKVAYLEKSVEVVKILVKDGFVGLWQRVLQMIDNFKQTIVGGIQKFVISSLIQGGISWLAGLSNPVGAVVKVVLAIYKIIKTFLERINQILDVANSIFSSIGAIAAGKIQDAADFIEKTMAATIPVVISFLAALVPITGITNSIRDIIKRLKTPVDLAMNKMITFLVKKAKKLFSKIISKLNRKRNLPSANFKIGNTPRRIYAEKNNQSIQVMIAYRKGTPIEQVDTETKEETEKLKSEEAKKIGENISGEISQADKATTKAEKKVNLNSKNQNQNKSLKSVKEEIDEAAKEMGAVGEKAVGNTEINDNPGGNTPLFRYRPERYEHEGKADTYSALKKLMDGKEDPSGVPLSTIFERDHIPTKKTLQNIRNEIVKGKQKEGGETSVLRTGIPPKKEEENPEPLGLLHSASAEGNAVSYPAIVLLAKLHGAKEKEDNKVKEIASSDKSLEEKIPVFKSHLITHVNDQVGAVRESYKQEKSPEITAKVEQGLVDITNKSIENFKLEQAPSKRPKVKEISKGSESRDDFTFNDAANEGKHDIHSKVQANYSKRGFIESDHILDDAFPQAIKSWKFSNLMGKRDATLAAIGEIESKEKRAEANRRRENLRKKNVFPKNLINYTRNSAETVAIFAGVHKAIAPPDKNGLITALKLNFDSNVKKSLLEYVTKGDGKSPEKLAKDVRGFASKKFLERFEAHKRGVMSGYTAQKDYVVSLNPSQSADAGQKMERIIARVKESMGVLRGKTEDLFKE